MSIINIIKNKKGATFFTLDTMIAGLVIVVTIILVLSIHSSKPVVEDTYHYLNNYMDFLTTTTMKDVRDDYQFAYDDAYMEDLDLFIYQKVYKLYVEGKEETAGELIKNLTNFIVPTHIGFKYMLGEEVVYNRTFPSEDLAKTSITSTLLTYYVDDSSDSLAELNYTSVSVWS